MTAEPSHDKSQRETTETPTDCSSPDRAVTDDNNEDTEDAGNHNDSLPPSSDGIPDWLTVAWMVILVATVIAGTVISNYTIGGPAETESYLLALATAQASIVALTFTITFLGIQLVANRFTLRTTSPFTGDRLFRIVIALFVISISVDFGLTIFIQTPSPALTPIEQYGVVVASALGLASVVSLPGIMQRTLSLSTPEGIAEELANQIDHRAAVHDAIEFPHNEVKSPLENLYSLATSAMFSKERRTAQVATNRYIRETSNLLELIDDEDWVIPGHGNIEMMINEIFRAELAVIARNAYRGDEQQLFRETIIALRQVGERTLDIDSKNTEESANIDEEDVRNQSAGQCNGAVHAMAGLDEVLSEIPPKLASADVYHFVVTQQLCLLRESVYAKRWEVVFEMLGILEMRIEELTINRRGNEVLDELLASTFQELQAITVRMLTRSRVSLGESLDITSDADATNLYKQPNTRVLQRTLYLLHRVTLTSIHNESGDLDFDDVTACWAAISARASGEPEDLDLHLTEIMFELSLASKHHSKSRDSASAPTDAWRQGLSKTAYINDWKTVEEAFNRCLGRLEEKTPTEEGHGVQQTVLPLTDQVLYCSPQQLSTDLEEIYDSALSKYAQNVWEEATLSEVRDYILERPASISPQLTAELDCVIGSNGILCREKGNRVLVRVIEGVTSDDIPDLKESVNQFKSSRLGRDVSNSHLVFVTPFIEADDSVESLQEQLGENTEIRQFNPRDHIGMKNPTITQFDSNIAESPQSDFLEPGYGKSSRSD